MSSKTSTYSGGGISALGLLGVAFIVLKLCGVIAWSWWYVTAPFWAVPAIIVVGLIVAAIVCMLLSLFIKPKRRAV